MNYSFYSISAMGMNSIFAMRKSDLIRFAFFVKNIYTVAFITIFFIYVIKVCSFNNVLSLQRIQRKREKLKGTKNSVRNRYQYQLIITLFFLVHFLDLIIYIYFYYFHYFLGYFIPCPFPICRLPFFIFLRHMQPLIL